MKIALVNPPWTFEGSIYFGCREAHLPLEYGYAKALLDLEGHQTRIFDGQLFSQSIDELSAEIARFGPDMTVIATAPSYLFWRCAPPELRVPRATLRALGKAAGRTVAVGPHGSTTPGATLRKLGVDAVVLGECEEVLVELARKPYENWGDVASLGRLLDGSLVVAGGPHASNIRRLPALVWDPRFLERHLHHHHRFDRPPLGPGAEIEASRGCPYHCTFCAKDNFRDDYRKRPLDIVLDEIDALLRSGVRYLYFIDEIFLPDRDLLGALAEREIDFGVQLRIDNWDRSSLELLGRAGCVSIEAGVESLSEHGRSLLAKRCKRSTEELTELLIDAKKHIPFVQANLLDSGVDDRAEIDAWRERLRCEGVWANDPVPMFSYPGSPQYALRWGAIDDRAWERAHADYLARHRDFSDIQDGRPLPLSELEK